MVSHNRREESSYFSFIKLTYAQLIREPDPEADPEQHGAEQSLKRSDNKAKHGMKLKYSPEIVSDGETL